MTKRDRLWPRRWAAIVVVAVVAVAVVVWRFAVVGGCVAGWWRGYHGHWPRFFRVVLLSTRWEKGEPNPDSGEEFGVKGQLRGFGNHASECL